MKQNHSHTCSSRRMPATPAGNRFVKLRSLSYSAPLSQQCNHFITVFTPPVLGVLVGRSHQPCSLHRVGPAADRVCKSLAPPWCRVLPLPSRRCCSGTAGTLGSAAGASSAGAGCSRPRTASTSSAPSTSPWVSTGHRCSWAETGPASLGFREHIMALAPCKG